MTSPVIDHAAKRARRTVSDARFAQAPNRAVADLPRSSAQPLTVPVSAERPPSAAPLRRAANWPQWIVVAVGSTALVVAGYLGALVQVGAMRPEASRPIQRTVTSASKAKPESKLTQTTVRAPALRAIIEPARVGATLPRPKIRRPDAKAAALATAELEREVYGRRPPVLAIRALPPAEATGPSGAQPSREAVQQSLLAMRPQLEACAAGRRGTVDARVRIAGSGRVTYTLIQGDFAGTPEGSCIARALRAATFPPFSGPVFQVQFPFAL